ncbi:TPA: hypothetical protein SC423_001556 [Campylobacter jejuni]|nr:hypothetical protein [Campylobacter jejuni]
MFLYALKAYYLGFLLKLFRIVTCSFLKYPLQLYKNYENLNIFERLYKLQEELYEKPIFKTIILQTSALKPIVLQEQFVNDGIFQFQKLYFQDQNYSVYFKE